MRIIIGCTGLVLCMGSYNATASECNEILSGGIFEIDSNSSSRERAESLQSLYRYQRQEGRIRGGASGNSFNLGISGLTDSFSFGSSRSRNFTSEDQFQKFLETESGLEVFESTEFDNYQTTASATIADAWSDCMNRNGLNVSYKLKPNNVVLLFSFQSPQNGVQAHLLELGLPDNVKCSGPKGWTSTTKVRLGPQETPFECTKKDNNSATIRVYTDYAMNGQTFIYLPATPPPPSLGNTSRLKIIAGSTQIFNIQITTEEYSNNYIDGTFRYTRAEPNGTYELRGLTRCKAEFEDSGKAVYAGPIEYDSSEPANRNNPDTWMLFNVDNQRNQVLSRAVSRDKAIAACQLEPVEFGEPIIDIQRQAL